MAKSESEILEDLANWFENIIKTLKEYCWNRGYNDGDAIDYFLKYGMREWIYAYMQGKADFEAVEDALEYTFGWSWDELDNEPMG